MKRRPGLELLFRAVATALIVGVAASLSVSAQARGGARIGACSLLTKDHPMGSTAAAIRPNTIALANAIIPKLR